MLIDPMATTTASRTEADVAERSGFRYLKRVRAETILSAAEDLEPLRPCWFPCDPAAGELPESASVVQAKTRYSFHCSTNKSGCVVGVLLARRALPGSEP